jgi:hypothetical protein
VGCRVTIEVTLSIDPAVVGENQCTARVANYLVNLGGAMVGWRPALNGTAAEARFKFKNLARRDTFVTDALAIAGVSLATFR